MDKYNKRYRHRLYTTPSFSQYLHDVDEVCAYALNGRKVDVAFIDQGLVPRGYFVSCLFDKVDIIVAHDTNGHRAIYAYDKIPEHPHYVRIQYTKGCGTTFWIRKDKTDLIRQLQEDFKPKR